MSKLTHIDSECKQLVFQMQLHNFYQPRRKKKTTKQHKNITMLHDDKCRQKVVGSKSWLAWQLQDVQEKLESQGELPEKDWE